MSEVLDRPAVLVPNPTVDGGSVLLERDRERIQALVRGATSRPLIDPAADGGSPLPTQRLGWKEASSRKMHLVEGGIMVAMIAYFMVGLVSGLLQA